MAPRPVAIVRERSIRSGMRTDACVSKTDEPIDAPHHANLLSIMAKMLRSTEKFVVARIANLNHRRPSESDCQSATPCARLRRSRCSTRIHSGWRLEARQSRFLPFLRTDKGNISPVSPQILNEALNDNYRAPTRLATSTHPSH